MLKTMDEAPKDGTRFLGKCGDDFIAMFWHDEFKEFCSSFRRIQMAKGFTIDAKPYQDHSPVVHNPSGWMPLIEEDSHA